MPLQNGPSIFVAPADPGSPAAGRRHLACARPQGCAPAFPICPAFPVAAKLGWLRPDDGHSLSPSSLLGLPAPHLTCTACLSLQCNVLPGLLLALAALLLGGWLWPSAVAMAVAEAAAAAVPLLLRCGCCPPLLPPAQWLPTAAFNALAHVPSELLLSAQCLLWASGCPCPASYTTVLHCSLQSRQGPQPGPVALRRFSCSECSAALGQCLLSLQGKQPGPVALRQFSCSDCSAALGQCPGTRPVPQGRSA